jgi:hypothetical protein
MANKSFSDEGESNSPSSRRKSSLPLILALIGGGVLLLVLVCGGVVFSLFRGLSQEIPAAQASAEVFLQDLRANNIDAAYAQTTPEFQSKTSPEEFRAFLKAFPAFTTHESSSLAFQGMHTGTGGSYARFHASLLSPNGASSCTLTLRKQGEAWRVHHLNTP